MLGLNQLLSNKMTAEIQQIVKAYEELHLGVEDIASERELDCLEVKMCLMQFSSQYRKDIKLDSKNERQLDFTDEQLERANQVISQIMDSSEDDNLRSRMARYIRDDKKGRKDGLKNVKKLQINVAMFNAEVMRNALKSIETAKSTTSKSIEIPITSTVEQED